MDDYNSIVRLDSIKLIIHGYILLIKSVNTDVCSCSKNIERMQKHEVSTLVGTVHLLCQFAL